MTIHAFSLDFDGSLSNEDFCIPVEIYQKMKAKATYDKPFKIDECLEEIIKAINERNLSPNIEKDKSPENKRINVDAVVKHVWDCYDADKREVNIEQLMILSNPLLMNEIQDAAQKDPVILLVGSNRQGYFLDSTNAKNISKIVQEGSCFHFFRNIAEKLSIGTSKVTFDEFVLADAYNDRQPGTSIKEAEEYYQKEKLAGKVLLKEQPKAGWVTDKNKVSIIYAQAHKLATDYPGEQIILSFTDDHPDIVNTVDEFYKNNPDFLPKNVTLSIQPYRGTELNQSTEPDGTKIYTAATSLPEPIQIKGTGKIDKHYPQTIKNMGEIAISEFYNRTEQAIIETYTTLANRKNDEKITIKISEEYFDNNPEIYFKVQSFFMTKPEYIPDNVIIQFIPKKIPGMKEVTIQGELKSNNEKLKTPKEQIEIYKKAANDFLDFSNVSPTLESLSQNTRLENGSLNFAPILTGKTISEIRDLHVLPFENSVKNTINHVAEYALNHIEIIESFFSKLANTIGNVFNLKKTENKDQTEIVKPSPSPANTSLAKESTSTQEYKNEMKKIKEESLLNKEVELPAEEKKFPSMM